MSGYTSRSEGIVPVEIDLPKQLVTFYSKRSVHLNRLPSYELIEGKGVIEPGEECYNTYGFPKVVRCPLKYETEEAEEKAVLRTAKLLHRLHKIDRTHKVDMHDIEIVDRNYMMNGRTRQIEIKAKIRGLNKVFYVKKPSVARIFGNALYNIVSGHEENDFVFSKSVFVQNGVRGRLVEPELKKRYLSSMPFLESAVRVDICDWFLSVNDLDNYRNFIVDSNNTIRIIDFDCMFYKQESEVSLLEFLVDEGAQIKSKIILAIQQDEKQQIRKRIVRNKKSYENLVGLMSCIPEFNQRVYKQNQVKNIKEYFAMQFAHLLD